MYHLGNIYPPIQENSSDLSNLDYEILNCSNNELDYLSDDTEPTELPVFPKSGNISS